MELEYGRNSGLLDKKYQEFFLPTILTAMATSMSIIVDGIIVGNLLGSAALAAVNLLLPVIMVYNIFAVLFGMGAATVISVAKGRRENKIADQVFTTSLLGMIAAGLLIMFGQIVFIEEIALIITENPILLPLVKDFLSILIYATPFLIAVPGSVYMLRTDGKAKLASLVLIGANVVNLVLDIVYIEVFKLGIKGASLATLSGYLVGMLILLTYFTAKDRTLKLDFEILKNRQVILQRTAKIATAGTPSALSSSLVPVKIFFVNLIVLGTAGKAGMAVFSVCISCWSLVSMFIAGAAQTMAPIIGTLYGERDYKGISFVVKRAFRILIAGTVTILVILQIFPEAILALFGIREPSEILIGVPAIRIFSLSLIGTSLSFLLLYYYMTIGKRAIANTISVLQGIVVVIPVAWILAKILGIKGVWAAFVIAEAVTLLVVLIYYQYTKRKAAGKVKDMLLLEQEEQTTEKIFDLSIKNTLEEAAGLSEKMTGFLISNGIPGNLSNRVGIAIEEMAVNTIQHGYKKPGDNCIDIKVIIVDGEVIISLRDDGDFFDPTKYKSEDALGGISIVNAVSESIEYNRVLGLNNTRIVIRI